MPVMVYIMVVGSNPNTQAALISTRNHSEHPANLSEMKCNVCVLPCAKQVHPDPNKP